jgi:enoyl-CoA hydratase/carnithine racemase
MPVNMQIPAGNPVFRADLMKLEFIQYEKAEHLATITLNRPEVLNALHPPAVEELNWIWADFRDDPALWAAIITGSGERAFCVGDDLKYRATIADEETLRKSESHPNYTPVECYKPVIAAVNGYALGGGLEVVLGCDMIIASENAQFGLPEARRGLLADAGGVIKIPRRIPYHLAMGMIMTGRMISAREAHHFGLVNEVVAPDDLRSVAQGWADEVLACSPLALRAAKQVIHKTIDMPQEKATDMIESLPYVRKLRNSDDYIEGPKAFAEKRKPIWKGS